MKFDGDIQTDIRTLAEKLLDSLLPFDLGDYWEKEVRIVDRAYEFEISVEAEKVIEKELIDEVFSMGRQKDQKFVDVTVEILCKAWLLIKYRMRAIMNRALQYKNFPGIGKWELLSFCIKD